MTNRLKKILLFNIAILLLLGVTACGGNSAPPADDIKPLDDFGQSASSGQNATNEQTETTESLANEDGTSSVDDETSQPLPEPQTGQEVLQRMETAIDAVQMLHAVIEFNLATAEGGASGRIEGWGERPAQRMRVNIAQSENDDLQGIKVSTDELAGWIFSPYQNTYYFSTEYPGNPYLQEQPELHALSRYARSVWNEGTLGENTEATLVSTEQIDEFNTYKVEVLPTTIPDESSLQDLKMTIWVDQTLYLPRQIDIETTFGGVTGTGNLVVLELMVNQPIDPTVFAFETAPEGAIVIDLNEIEQYQPTEDEELVSDTPE
ncbi:hypothetical protein QUF64_03240 [Anaerolineales bacterium HSG6]|nr:hypothetical protein [Anaerolineales bacterium HSG6]MDM8531555.1 hypothetical protein [Anaerolineales bacterium HSG25]